MTEHLEQFIGRMLKPGYTLVKLSSAKGSGRYGVVDPHGERLKVGDTGAYVTFTDSASGGSYRQQLISTLRRAGAIPAIQRREAKPREIKSTSEAPEKNPLMLVDDIMRDTRSTPRERAVAREFLALQKKYETLRDLARQLGDVIKELRGD